VKILQIAHSLPFLNQAGTEVYTMDLSGELSKRHEVSIFTRFSDDKREEYSIDKRTINGIGVYALNNTFKYCDSFEKYYANRDIDDKFDAILNEIMPDVVHIQHMVFLSVGIIEKIKLRKIPIIFTLHDYWLMCPKWHILKKGKTPCERVFKGDFGKECADCAGDLLNIRKEAKDAYLSGKKVLPRPIMGLLKKMYLLFNRMANNSEIGIDRLKERRDRIWLLLNNIDLFIAPSAYIKGRFMEFGLPSSKIKLSEYGTNTGLLKRTEKKGSENIRFTFIGTILPAKGIDVLIKSFNALDSKAAELKIYGRLRPYAGFEYYPGYLKKMTRNRNIRFMGEFRHSSIAEIMNETDVLVVPSVWDENSPLVISEAFLFNVPVIASRVGGIPEMVNDGVNGFLFKPGDADDLRQKIIRVAEDRAILSRFRKNIIPPKSIEDSAEEIEEIYKESLDKKEICLSGRINA
jgi:glycosyltransferase involved in cell wall biosynthesis